MARRRPWCRWTMTDVLTPYTNVAKMRHRHSLAMRWGDRVVVLCFIAAVLLFLTSGIGLYMGLYGDSLDAWAWGTWIFGLSVYATIPLSAFMLLGLVLKVVGKRRIKKKLLIHRCHVCVHCSYDLTARPSGSVVCPECGEYTPRRECVRLWCKLLRSRF